jgi:nudix-type nucleoside diphosphatase (YffH/AdpP family)
MGWYGRKDPTDFAPILSGVFRRAWSFAMNESGPAEAAPERRFDCVHHHRPYLNFFGVEEWDLRHTRHDGTMSGVMNRGALMVGNASVVLPYDPVRDCVLLTEQFRAPLAMAGEPNPWTWEPVAGLIDAGETAEEAAHREAMEEARLKLERLEPAGRVYSSTGAVAECLYLFVGLCDLSEPPQDGGLAEEDEDIRSKRLSFAALMQGIDAQRYLDQPLVTCALWLARHRERLRA